MAFSHLAHLLRSVHARTATLIAVIIVATTSGAAYRAAAQNGPAQAVNTPPGFLVVDSLTTTTYDGNTDDLLTAGLGQDGLANPEPPGFADPDNPTPAELRRRAIYTNYRALVDMTEAGGYGRLFGPAVGTDGDGKIPGKEYLVYADDGTGTQNVTMMVQIPDTFDPQTPCIVTGPSSGSRGVYGAIASSGEWGLKQGCAVAYTDKGTGIGAHELISNTVTLIRGERQDATTAGATSNFTAEFSPTYTITNPHRLAFKHAHSQQNPEQDWGRHVLQSVEFAFYILNLPENFGEQQGANVLQTITPENTIVIGSSVSNGGGASLRAAEQDTAGLIDGVAVSEPNVNPVADETLVIQQGEREWPFPNHSRTLFDYITFLNVYQPCANLAPDIVDIAPFNQTPAALGENRCTALQAKGLLESDTVAEQAAEAQDIINAYGILEEQNILQPSYQAVSILDSVAVTYANAYGRFRVDDNLCGYSFAGVDANFVPAPLTTAQLAALFAVGNGIPPTGGVQLINNNSVGGPLQNQISVSPSSSLADQNLDGALCLRRLATGVDEAGDPLTGAELAQHQRIMQGIDGVLATGNLQGKPAIIVQGRVDALIHPNFAGRPYFGLNQIAESANSNLRYYEVTNAQHLDAFIGVLPGYDSRFVPLHHYFFEALDLLYDHLQNDTPLPASQVVDTIPRGSDAEGAVPPLTRSNLPPVDPDPAAAFTITFGEVGPQTVFIPDTPDEILFPIISP